MAQTGLIYSPIYLEHDTGGHIENKKRLIETMSLLEQSGLMAQLTLIEPRPATNEELLEVHAQQHIEAVKRVAEGGGGWLDADTVTSASSYEAALYAAGGVLRGVEAVMRGEAKNVFALVRPPGHHATYWKAMGFCLFNNVAIAAKYATRAFGLERILIVDFDVHHGNGTQDAFYHDPGILYFSTHQYPFYPGTGAINDLGMAMGKGTNVNVPLPPWCGDTEYLQVFDQILLPVARGFRPQFVLVSAGYDAHWADDMSAMQVSVEGFARMAKVLKGIAAAFCQGRILFCLEGGYHLVALAASVRATLEVLMGIEVSEDPLGKPREKVHVDIRDVLQLVKQAHGL